TVTFEDRMVLYDGEREIQLWHPGFAAHTVGDATAYLPKERILFAGDIAFLYVTPLAFQGHVGNWIKAADRLLRFDADVIVPGHGPVGTRKDLKNMRDYLALVRREARQRFDAGMPAEAAAADIKLGVHAPDPRRDLVDGVLVEPFHVDHAGAELASLAVALPEIDLAELAARELEHELVGARLEKPGKVRLVGAAEARAAEAVAEADVKGELHVDARGSQVEEPGHLLAGDVAAGRLVELDEVGARRDESAELGGDDLGEALRDVDDALVNRARMDPRA